MWHSHLAGSALRLLSQRREVASFSTTQQRQEHDLAGEHHFRGDGPLSGGRWLDHQRSLRSLPAHKPNRVRAMLEERGLELLYLPSYSPDYNPIEEAFAKIKEILRRACARTREALLEALGEALSAVSFQDAQGFFEHAGYHTTAQLS